METDEPSHPTLHTAGPIRAAATVNMLAGSALALAALFTLVLGILADERLSIGQGDVTLRPTDAAVLVARIAVILCLAGGAVACWRARLAMRAGTERSVARACWLGVAGGLLATLPVLGSLLGMAFGDELDAPLGMWALRLLALEPFLPGSLGGSGSAWISIRVGGGISPLQLFWLWPLGIALVNATARALTPALTGALDPQDRRRALAWLLPLGLLGVVLPFVPTSTSIPHSDYAARRYVRAILAGTPPAESKYHWADCPPALRRYSATDLSQISPPPASPAAKIRILQRAVTGPGAATNLQQYRFSYTEQGATASATWLVVTVEITLQDGSTRAVTLALSKHPGEWRVAPPRK